METGHQNTIKVVQRKSNITPLKNTKDITLSIQFSLDGFSFCVSDSTTKKGLFFTEYLFDETQKSPKVLLKEIQQIFKKDKNLQLDFEKVDVIHENNLSTLVPDTYFDEKLLTNYLNYNIKTLKTDYIAFDEISNINTKNVYIPYVNINNYLFQNFGEFDYKHHHTILLEKLLEIEKSKEKVMYINVSKNTFDLVIIENSKLVLINSFKYHSKEDFIYYILFTAEQLELNTEEFKLYFTGAITTESSIYKITHKYIRNISFLESKNKIFTDLETPNHSYFILLG